MTQSTTGTPHVRNDAARVPVGWRWAPAWVLAFVALWPAPGYAEGVMVLGALAAIVRLLLARFRGGTMLLTAPAWALTSVLFVAYWTPELLSSFDAIDRAHALKRPRQKAGAYEQHEGERDLNDDECAAHPLALATARRATRAVAQHRRQLGLAGADERDRAEEDAREHGDDCRHT